MFTEAEQRVLASLADRASLAAALLATLADCDPRLSLDVHTLVQRAGRPLTDEQGALDVLARAATHELLACSNGLYRTLATASRLKHLAYALAAIGFYREQVHKDATRAQVILTKPARPSQLEEELARMGWRANAMEPTPETFARMVGRAHRRVVLLSPFFDDTGARWLQELFRRVNPRAARVLVLRHLDNREHPSYPRGYDRLAEWLARERVAVYSYSLPRPDSFARESFHAKVLLCDEHFAYVGSANLTEASLGYSMELGIAVEGVAAHEVALIVGAILHIARRVI